MFDFEEFFNTMFSIFWTRYCFISFSHSKWLSILLSIFWNLKLGTQLCCWQISSELTFLQPMDLLFPKQLFSTALQPCLCYFSKRLAITNAPCLIISLFWCHFMGHGSQYLVPCNRFAKLTAGHNEIHSNCLHVKTIYRWKLWCFCH